jgi:predicted regulator of Ras-like GTPase activity (Roadblock/LC7/MglB family)
MGPDGIERQVELDPAEQNEIEAALSELLEVPGVLGARVIRRQGKLVYHQGVDYGRLHDFSVLTASLLNGGEFLFSEIGLPGDVRVVLKTDDTRVHLSGLGIDHFLATVTDNTHAWEEISPHVHRIRADLLRVLERTPLGPK